MTRVVDVFPVASLYKVVCGGVWASDGAAVFAPQTGPRVGLPAGDATA